MVQPYGKPWRKIVYFLDILFFLASSNKIVTHKTVDFISNTIGFASLATGVLTDVRDHLQPVLNRIFRAGKYKFLASFQSCY